MKSDEKHASVVSRAYIFFTRYFNVIVIRVRLLLIIKCTRIGNFFGGVGGGEVEQARD